MTVRVRAFPRLHLGLLDLGDVTPRRFGGVGLALDRPWAEVYADPAEQLDLVFPEDVDRSTGRRVRDRLTRLLKARPGPNASLTVRRALPRHIGLGATTAVTLAALRAAAAATGRAVPRDELKILSGRGATSGIGVNAFFSGGFIIDGGHPASPGLPHLPSRYSQCATCPPVNIRLRVPATWSFHLMLPNQRGLSGSAERDFFLKATPIPRQEVLEAVVLAYTALLPAFRDGDLDLLRTSLRAFSRVGFKRRECRAQSAPSRALREHLERRFPWPVGLSSVGPLLFVVTERGNRDAAKKLRAAAHDFDARYLCCALGRNSGHSVSTVSHV